MTQPRKRKAFWVRVAGQHLSTELVLDARAVTKVRTRWRYRVTLLCGHWVYHLMPADAELPERLPCSYCAKERR